MGAALSAERGIGVPANTSRRTISRALERVRQLVPQGTAISERTWQTRHRVIVTLLGLHVVGIALFAFVRGFGISHGLLEASPIAASALVGRSKTFSRHTRSMATTFGLITASAIIVHLSGGTIEAHFHFFVMVGVISLYQSWGPFILAILYVVVQHGVMGVLDPGAVYNHASAIAHPWRWAVIHGTFVLAASAAQLASWRFSETARERTELMLESTGEGIIGVDSAQRITFINRSGGEMLGIDQHDAVGDPIDGVLMPTTEDGSVYPDADFPLKRTLASGIEVSVRDVWLGRAPRRFPSAMMTTPVVWRDKVIGAMVSIRDISESIQATDALNNTLSLLTATLESTADGVLVVDNDGKITSLNRKFVEMWKIPDEVLASKDDDRALSFVLEQLKDPDGFLAKVRELYATPDAESHDILEFKDGRVFERYSMPQAVDGISVGRVWSFRDITERRRLDEMKDGFLSAVSHELRTPLTSVIGYASTLQRHQAEFAPDQSAEMLERLAVNARKLERLLSDLLDIDKLSRGSYEPRRTPTDVGELIRRVVSESELLLEREVSIADGQATAAIDAAKVERIIENLLINAARHTPPDARIWVHVRPCEHGVVIAVEDEGPGVPEEYREAIFEPFRQGPTVRAHSPGVGVGLSLVARFAEAHGGGARVDARLGGGASFRVHLPSAAGSPAHSCPVFD